MKKKVIKLLTVILISIIITFISNIYKTKAATTTLADTVIAEAGTCTSWSSGFSGVCQTNGHEYRYVGANVNNYVSFNNDLYRIIGVFDSNSTGVNANLVKLISARSIGSYTWGTNNSSPAYTTFSSITNNWEIANAKILLNEYFLNASDISTTYGDCINWTYFFSDSYVTNNIYKTDCSNIVGYGIQTTNLRNYIQPVTWYLKGLGTTVYSKSDFYNCERGQTTGNSTKDSNCKSGNGGAYSATITNTSVGLIYVSDYLYASGYYASTNTDNGSSSSYGRQNWLYNGFEWTITPNSSTSWSKAAFSIDDGDLLDINGVSNARPIRPTFYLKSQVYVTDGNGSFHNPYTIACDNCSS